MSKDDLNLTWTAFKTPKKVGVSGTFNELGLEKDSLSAKSFSGLLGGVKFAISTKTVATKDSGRDQKIATFFFKEAPSIKGAILEASDTSLLVGIEMNGVKKEVPMKVKLQDESFVATGSMDVLEFGMSENLKSLNKACFELHEGKTWSDVDLKLSGKLTKICN